MVRILLLVLMKFQKVYRNSHLLLILLVLVMNMLHLH
nr:MAG TPA: hypothetical protein [Caudoviricetes sp.]